MTTQEIGVATLEPADLISITTDVLSSLELSFEPTAESGEVEVATTGSVTISGAWEGSVLLELAPGLDAQLAKAMFQADEVSEEEIGDAVGELTNMIGGSIKSLLLEPSRLSLPTVVSGSRLSLRVPGSVMVGDLVGWCQGAQLRVSVWAVIPGR